MALSAMYCKEHKYYRYSDLVPLDQLLIGKMIFTRVFFERGKKVAWFCEHCLKEQGVKKEIGSDNKFTGYYIKGE
jgi:hypothetical protein